MTYAELQRLDVGGGERVPLLEELLMALPGGAYLDLELKEEMLRVQDCAPIAALLDTHIERRRLMVSSFGSSLLFPFRGWGFTVGWLVGEDAAARGVRAFAGTLLRLRPQYINLPIEVRLSRAAPRRFFFRSCVPSGSSSSSGPSTPPRMRSSSLRTPASS